jgi:hypothetical protein
VRAAGAIESFVDAFFEEVERVKLRAGRNRTGNNRTGHSTVDFQMMARGCPSNAVPHHPGNAAVTAPALQKLSVESIRPSVIIAVCAGATLHTRSGRGNRNTYFD